MLGRDSVELEGRDGCAEDGQSTLEGWASFVSRLCCRRGGCQHLRIDF